jgi:hypothetical protein
MPWPPSPFGVPWDELTLDKLQAFLHKDPPPTEGQPWEAKGYTITKEQIHDAVSAFGNTFDGGYPVLGIDQDEARPAVERLRVQIRG